MKQQLQYFVKNQLLQLSSSSIPMKLNCCFKSEFSNSVCLLKSIAINLKSLKYL